MNALAPLGVAQDSHLEALAVLLLAVRLLASAAVDVLSFDVSRPCALRLACSSFHLQLLVVRSAALRHRLPSLALLDEQSVRAKVLDLWLEGHWVPVSNVPSRKSDFFNVCLSVHAVFAHAGLIAEAALCEALAVHLEALGPGALASQILNSCALLLEQCQLRIKCHRGLPLERLLAWASRLALL